MTGTLYLHLAPREAWEKQVDLDEYTPEVYAADGFIHLTIGEANVIAVGNRYYGSDLRPYVVLVIDPTRIESPVRFDDDSGIYPHVYGPLNVSAVLTVRPVLREAGGEFVEIVEQAG